MVYKFNIDGFGNGEIVYDNIDEAKEYINNTFNRWFNLRHKIDFEINIEFSREDNVSAKGNLSFREEKNYINNLKKIIEIDNGKSNFKIINHWSKHESLDIECGGAEWSIKNDCGTFDVIIECWGKQGVNGLILNQNELKQLISFLQKKIK